MTLEEILKDEEKKNYEENCGTQKKDTGNKHKKTTEKLLNVEIEIRKK